MSCERDKYCDDYLNRRVKLGYVADAPTFLRLVDSIGDSKLDLTPIVKAAETTTRLELDAVNRRINLYNEDDQICSICIADIADLIKLTGLEDVNVPNPADGSTIIYDVNAGEYVSYDLAGNISRIDADLDSLHAKDEDLQSQIDNSGRDITEVNNRVDQVNEWVSQTNDRIDALANRVSALETNLTTLTNTVNAINSRLTAIENAIWDWGSDKNTKIARGNINIYSGSVGGGVGIFSRADNQNNDLQFE